MKKEKKNNEKAKISLDDVVDAVKSAYYGVKKGSPEREKNYKNAVKTLNKYNHEYGEKLSLRSVKELIHYQFVKVKQEALEARERLSKSTRG